MLLIDKICYYILCSEQGLYCCTFISNTLNQLSCNSMACAHSSRALMHEAAADAASA